jgi:hypothetical protein
MPSMNPVEVANGRHAPAMRRAHVMHPSDQFHGEGS